MISPRHQTAYCAVGILAVTAIAFAQPAADPAADHERQILATIAHEQAQNGPHSEGLISPLSILARLYRDQGDDAFAVAAIERLLQVLRANDGLHSLDQVAPIQQLIKIEESAGDTAAAWDLEQRLLTLARRHPDDLRTVPVLHDAADKRVQIVRRLQTGVLPPEIELGCYGGWPRSDLDTPSSGCKAGARSEIARAIVSDAQRNYAEAIAVLLRNRQYGSEELRDLEAGILDSLGVVGGEPGEGAPQRRGATDLLQVDTAIEPWRSWAEALGALTHLDFPNPTGLTLVPGSPSNSSVFDYLLGRESLVRSFAYELAAPAPLSVQIEAFLRIADWDLLYARNKLALDEYAQVHRLLDDRGARASIDDLFAPKLPVVLPAYSPNPLATAEADAYVDVAFEVTQFGASRKVEIAGATANVAAADKDDLVNLIKARRFRPRTKDGEPVHGSPVTVRYYLGY